MVSGMGNFFRILAVSGNRDSRTVTYSWRLNDVQSNSILVLIINGIVMKVVYRFAIRNCMTGTNVSEIKTGLYLELSTIFLLYRKAPKIVEKV